MIRLAVRCSPDLAEVVLAELTVLAPNGVEETAGDGFVEYAIYGGPGEIPELGDVEAAAGDGLIEVSSREVADDWADRWQDFHKPVLVADRLWLRPSWEPAPDDDVLDIVVDPGQAFGTGAHATTRLCLELMAELAGAGEAGGPLTDLGSGSGVLAIAGAKLGWEPVAGYDNEGPAVIAARENAGRNDARATFEACDFREGLPPLAQTVVANLTGPLLREVAAAMATAGAPPDTLVCSGLLATEADAVSAAFAHARLEESGRRQMGDWGALLLRGVGYRQPR